MVYRERKCGETQFVQPLLNRLLVLRFGILIDLMSMVFLMATESGLVGVAGEEAVRKGSKAPSTFLQR